MSRTPPGYTNLDSIKQGIAARKADAKRRREEIERKQKKPKRETIIVPGKRTSRGRIT